MKIFGYISRLPVRNDCIEQKNQLCRAVVSMVLRLDLVKDNCVMRQCPVNLRCFKELIEDGIDRVLAVKPIGDEFIFESSNFVDELEDFLLSLAFGFSFPLHIFIIESIIQVDLIIGPIYISFFTLSLHACLCV